MNWIRISALLIFTTFIVGAQEATEGAKGGETEAEPVAIHPDTFPPPAQDAPEPAKLETKQKKDKDDNLLQEYSYYVDEHGREVKHGPYTTYYDNGRKRREVTYRHGLPNGLETWWHTNGAIWRKFKTKAGVREGRYEEFHRTGRLIRRALYKNGHPIGR